MEDKKEIIDKEETKDYFLEKHNLYRNGLFIGTETIKCYKYPISMTCCSDVNILLEYESDVYHSFKVYSYRGYMASELYFVMMEDDKYPIIINGEDVNNVGKVKTLVYNTWFDRYR